MSHTIKFSIEVEASFHDNEYALEVQNRLIKKLIADRPERMSFEELKKILCLSGLQYYVRSVDFAQKSPNEDESITKIVITG